METSENKMQQKSMNDLEVKSLKDDKLNVEAVVKGLSFFIQRSETPITVSVQGDWGSGKTSMMRMLSNELENSKFPVYWINTWQYSITNNNHSILYALLMGLARALDGNDDKDENVDSEIGEGKNFTRFRELVKGLSYATSLTGVVAPYAPVLFDMLYHYTGKSTLNKKNKEGAEKKVPDRDLDYVTKLKQLKIEFQNEIETIAGEKGKVVFFIDDLDRLQPNQAVEVLEALKVLFNCEKCVYIIAIDFDVVKEGVCSKYSITNTEDEVIKNRINNFFDKIIQVRFNVPVKQYNLNKLVNDYLTKTFITNKNREQNGNLIPILTKFYVDVLNDYVGTNPRKIKRIFNSALLLYNINFSKKKEGKQNNISGALAYSVAFMIVVAQICLPEVYKWLEGEISKLNNSDNKDGQINFSGLYKIKGINNNQKKFMNYYFCIPFKYLKGSFDSESMNRKKWNELSKEETAIVNRLMFYSSLV